MSLPRAIVALMLLVGCGASQSRPEVRPIRVGTTGDHPPFSAEIDGGFVGIDIDMAHDLGTTLDRPIQFVRTTWNSAASDLVAGRFDILMSGVYVTRDRQAVGHFSKPYAEIGRHAVLRCTDLARFGRAEDVNRLGVQILSTLGSANHDFVRENFPRASIIPARDPAHAIARLASGGADVLFTNAYHARHQTGRDRRLCVGLGDAMFGRPALAFLLPEGSELLGRVDEWLFRRALDGTVSRMIVAHTNTRPNGLPMVRSIGRRAINQL